jgi:predicted  nucleic acid-binding Zn-ribbon protein
MAKANIVEVDHTYSELLRNLDMFEQELNVLNAHIGELIKKSPEGASPAKDYEQRILSEKQNIEHLRRSIHESIDAIGERSGQDGEWYLENKLGKQYRQLHEEFQAELRSVNKLKQDFSELSKS